MLESVGIRGSPGPIRESVDHCLIWRILGLEVHGEEFLLKQPLCQILLTPIRARLGLNFCQCLQKLILVLIRRQPHLTPYLTILSLLDQTYIVFGGMKVADHHINPMLVLLSHLTRNRHFGVRNNPIARRGALWALITSLRFDNGRIEHFR